MTPAEIRFELARRLLSLANARGMVPLITDVHSIVVEGDEVSILYDIVPGDGPLLFEFQRPVEVARSELTDFVRWLAWSDRAETLH